MNENAKYRAICLKKAEIYGKDKEGEKVLLGSFPKGHLILCRGWKLRKMREKGEAESVKFLAKELGLPYDGSQKQAEAVQAALVRSWNVQPVTN